MQAPLIAVLLAFAGLVAPAAAAAAGPARGYADADYLAYADGLVARLADTWDPAAGFYRTGAPSLDSRYNAALLSVYATAASTGWTGAARDDARARALAARLTQSPPFSEIPAPPHPDTMFHTPGWIGTMEGGYDVMDKAIDPKIVEGLLAAWRARGALRLPGEVSARIADEITRVAHGPFFRFPNVRLNQINWPAELYAAAAETSGSADLLAGDYRGQLQRFVGGVRRPWSGSRLTGATNLSPTYRFHYQINEPAQARRNVDSAEYANMTLHALSFYDQAIAAGMSPLPSSDLRVLRAWVRRDLLGYWLHSGFMNWDTGLGYRRWMKGKTWAYALQGLQTIARADAFWDDPRDGEWAKEVFDRALDFYARQPPDFTGLIPSALFGVDPGSVSRPDSRMLAARMAASAARAVASGLGRMAGAVPPPYYAFDPDVGRLAVSTAAYGTAVVAVNRSAFPYGGLDLARLFDADGDPIATVGSHLPAAFGLEVLDRSGRTVLTTATGQHATPRRPPLAVRTPGGWVRRMPRSPRAIAGTFTRLEAVGVRRTHELEATTRHEFGPEAITETWAVRRRRGRARYSVRVSFPSWGAGASVAAELRDGRVLALPVGQRVRLAQVRRFAVRGTRGGYWVTPLRGARGSAKPIAVAAQRSAPEPGPTLRITLRRHSRFAGTSLRARITPLAAAGLP